MSTDSCRSCRRPIQWVEGIGWLHDELPQYAAEPITCEQPVPVCLYRTCPVSAESSAGCTCVSGKPPAQVQP